MYITKLEKLLNEASAMEGDMICVKIGAKTYEGFLLPRTSGVPEDTLTIKLSNGYNVGLKYAPDMQIKKTGAGTKLSEIPKLKIIQNPALPSIAIVGSGGTIGTHVDYRTGGVYMSRTPEEILSMVPELQDFVNIKTIASPFQTASEDMSIENWRILADEIANQLNDPQIKGVVLTHGTDTMHYTSAALAFMLKNLSKPVAMVGAQRSPDRASFDGALNLICGAHFAAYSDFAEVAVVMHGSSSDDFCFAHRGTKVRKMHTSRRDAFKSINEIPLAKIFPDGKIEILNQNYSKRKQTPIKTIADTAIEKKVAILKMHPDANPALLDFLITEGYRGIILEGTGLGHVPTGESGIDPGSFDKKMNWLPAVKKATEKGVIVAITSQSIYGRVNPFIYRNLRLLSDAGAIFCEDMLPEVAFAKLSYVLGHAKTLADAKKLMQENLAGEINGRLTDADIL